MCCFSGPVTAVSATNIFARPSTGNRQFIVYSMHLNTRSDVAMILPIPIAPHSNEQAVKFINLEKYADFFKDMDKGFPMPQSRGLGGFKGEPAAGAKTALEVVAVGSFEASFVPTIGDFKRLDSRFRLPDKTWDKLPQYHKYGFAVFKLKPGAKTIHPMAFDFPRADASKLFFPTVHIHDGQVHPKAGFDHSLFCQMAEGGRSRVMHWMESPQPAASFMDATKSKGIVDAKSHCYLHKINGNYTNEDVWI